jgi:1,2-diacylglycerol 3-beta-galactosyltransferase
MAVLDFIYFDAGGGHRASAEAVRESIARSCRPWSVRLVNLQELLDPIDIVRKATGIRLQDVYNSVIRRGWTLGSPQMLRALKALIQSFHESSTNLIARHWRVEAVKPDLVVSFVPHFNRALLQGLRRALPDVPFATVLTDLADCPRHFWLERQEQTFICGSQRAVEQGIRLGIAERNLRLTSGMVIHPRFHDAPALDVAQEREKLGLRPDGLTGLVMFGGMGSKDMLLIERKLARAGVPVQLIHVCGKNQRLRERLQAEPLTHPRYVEGFTSEMPYFMKLADFFIGKPGPGSISEALSMGLPVIVQRNIRTLPQERYNTDWILENQVGMVLTSFRQIVPAVSRLASTAQLGEMKAGVARIRNRAVFEVPELLAQLLKARQ